MKPSDQLQPPKWALKALRFICHPDFIEEIEGDVLEKYHADREKYGLKTARKQLFRHLLSVAKPNLIFNLNQQNMRSVFKIRESPAGLLLLTAIAILAAIVFTPIAGIDFQHKTMFGVPLPLMVWIIPSLLVSSWGLYSLTRRFLYSHAFTWAHILVTLITTFLILAVLLIGIKPSQPISDRHELIGSAMQLLFLVFVLGQFIYLANLMLGFLGKRKAQ